MMSLPHYFVLYIPSRHSTDPYAGFVLVRSSVGPADAHRLTPEPSSNLPCRLLRLSSAKKPTKIFTVSFENYGPKEVWDWENILQIKTSSGLRIPILTVTGHSQILSRGIKRNILVQEGPPTLTTPASLSPFIARQLLELAQLKRESCPITAEEFTTGSTAVLPCGHLFSSFAITESFKKVAGQCPACRAAGTPIYV
jgi:hypothetical protein